MTEREEIIRALEICATICGAGPECEGCPYYPQRGHGCMNALMRDAAEAMKEAVRTNGRPGHVNSWYYRHREHYETFIVGIPILERENDGVYDLCRECSDSLTHWFMEVKKEEQ